MSVRSNLFIYFLLVPKGYTTRLLIEVKKKCCGNYSNFGPTHLNSTTICMFGLREIEGKPFKSELGMIQQGAEKNIHVQHLDSSFQFKYKIYIL